MADDYSVFQLPSKNVITDLRPLVFHKMDCSEGQGQDVDHSMAAEITLVSNERLCDASSLAVCQIMATEREMGI